MVNGTGNGEWGIGTRQWQKEIGKWGVGNRDLGNRDWGLGMGWGMGMGNGE